jgi:hypothetical protein
MPLARVIRADGVLPGDMTVDGKTIEMVPPDDASTPQVLTIDGTESITVSPSDLIVVVR